jgi:DNA-binding transcriptional ArsR family regulator
MREKGGLGTALRRRLGIPVVPGAGERPEAAESLLMNPTRLRIFQAVYNLPCSGVRQLSRKVGVAPPSVRWHLSKLSEGGLVASAGPAARMIYYVPGGLDEEDVAVLSFIGREDRRAALRALCQEPGLTQLQLARASGCKGHTIRVLAARGIIEPVKDGRNRRYYPGAMLARRTQMHEDRARRARQLLLATLSREGLCPESAEPGGGFLDIRVRPGKSAETLRFRRNPYDLSRW